MNDSNINFSNNELTVINNINRNIIATLDYQEVLQHISDGMSELLNIEKGALYTIEKPDNLYLAAATPPLPPDFPEIFRKTTLKENPIIERAVKTQCPQYVPDATREKLSPTEKKIIELSMVNCLLYFPLISDNSVIAILILSTSNSLKTYSEKEIHLAQMVANQLTAAIQRASLFKELTDHKNHLEELVVERTHELEAANEEMIAANEELMATNEELYSLNELVSKQKEKLESSLLQMKEMQIKLIQAEKMASIGILTAGVAHEINNPLNFINGARIGLETFFEQKPPEIKQQVDSYLFALKTGTERAAKIVKGLYQFSATNTKSDEKCDIHEILTNCLVMLYPQYKYRVNIEKNYSTEGIVITGNVGMLHQAFFNIILNAFQSIAERGKIIVSTRSIDNIAQITVSDNGYGIDVENLKRIFDPFFTTKEPGEGTGIGLAIAYSVIKQHKGEIDVHSEKGKGSNFVITLPFK